MADEMSVGLPVPLKPRIDRVTPRTLALIAWLFPTAPALAQADLAAAPAGLTL